MATCHSAPAFLCADKEGAPRKVGSAIIQFLLMGKRLAERRSLARPYGL